MPQNFNYQINIPPEKIQSAILSMLISIHSLQLTQSRYIFSKDPLVEIKDEKAVNDVIYKNGLDILADLERTFGSI